MPGIFVSGGGTSAAGGGFGEGAHVYNNATQAVASTGETVLAFNTERSDSSGFHDNVTNNSRLTVPTGLGGVFLFGVNLEFAAQATGHRQARFRKNGADANGFGPYEIKMAVSTAGVSTHLVLVAEFTLAAGDYLEVLASQNTGSDLNVALSSATNFRGCEFWCRRAA